MTLYRNGGKAGTIPNPRDVHSTKLSGLAVDTEYVFHLVLRTSAGTYSSEKLAVRTHKMTELSGITITPGHMPATLRESLQKTVERIGAKIVDTVRIDTTHFVCTEGRGQAWERAVENNIPVVVPDWVKGCEREGRIVGVRGYYLNADPRLRNVGPGVGMQQRSPQPPPQPSPTTQVTPPTPERASASSHQERGREDDRPPPPPPKFEREKEKVAAEAPEPKSATEEQKVRTEDLKPMSPSVEDEEETESEEEETSGEEKAAEAGLSTQGKQGGRETPEDDGASFHDVKL